MNDYSGQVSHNSFLQAFAETGLPGGYLFLSAYAIAVLGILRTGRRSVRIVDPDLQKLMPVLVAATVCYCVGMMSLTRNYVIPTYLILGIATVYLRMVRTEPEMPPVAVSMGLLGKTFALAVSFLVVMHVFVMAFVRWG